MTKAEQRAFAYAKMHSNLGYDYDQTYDAVKYGYLQAEKDLALTWEDMALAFKCVNAALDDCDGRTREEVLKDALRRFNEQR